MATNVSLTPELEEFVNSKVRAGDYKSVSEVVRDSLRLLKEKDLLQQAKLAALREAVQKGIDSGKATPLNMDEIIAEARKQQKS
ncbi:MAG TPA: type II toxin-antitoxin system ParD family antitoxin [Gammaproteobacteria bacterium]|nr:type II toxin-antitoxin system ParD family antitoxin [Gammaproteobacteria bacterium]